MIRDLVQVLQFSQGYPGKPEALSTTASPHPMATDNDKSTEKHEGLETIKLNDRKSDENGYL